MLLETYSKSHVKSIIKSLGLDIRGETGNDFLCLCPFHGNRDTPSFSVSVSRGLYVCFNPACDQRGTIVELVKHISEKNGGKLELNNLRPICQGCNHSMGTTNMDDYIIRHRYFYGK